MYSKLAYGKKQPGSLGDFKERNGFMRFGLHRYYLPLTSAGQFALRFGLHPSMADRIPESLAARLREFRNSWNNRKRRTAAEIC